MYACCLCILLKEVRTLFEWAELNVVQVMTTERMAAPNWMNFRKSFKRGGGVIFNPKSRFWEL